MKLDQIAFYCETEEAERKCKASLGLLDASWAEDVVTGKSRVMHPDGSVVSGLNVGLLKFNYDLGIEVEILRYISGIHWHRNNPVWLAKKEDDWMQSHIGFHIADGADFPPMNKEFNLVQETETVSHTNPFLTDPNSRGFGRKYKYKIFSTPTPGLYFKYIARVNPPQYPSQTV